MLSLFYQAYGATYHVVHTSIHPNRESYFFQRFYFSFGGISRINITIDSICNLNYTFLYAYEEDPQKLNISHVFSSTKNEFAYSGEPNDFSTFVVLRGIFNKTIIDFTINCDEISETFFGLPQIKENQNAILELATTFIFLVLTITFSNYLERKSVFFILFMLLSMLLIPFYEKEVIATVDISHKHFYCCPCEYVPKKHRTGLLERFEDSYSKDKSIIYKPITHCPSCKFSTLNYSGNSTPRDLVVTLGSNRMDNIYGFVKSLRTSGCKATIIICTNVHPPNDILGCGVTFIEIQYYRNIPGEYNLKATRWQVLADLLNILDPNDFDRVYYSDLFDTVFQGDPFTEEFTKDKVLLSDEEGPLGENIFFNALANNSHHGLDYYSWGQFSNHNSGIFGSGFQNARLIFNTVGNWFPLVYETYPFHDQAIFNVLIHSEPFRNMNPNIYHYKRGENITSVFNWRGDYSSTLPVRFKDGRIPVAVHQIYRLGNVPHQLELACNPNAQF